MKALKYLGPRDIGFREVPIPEPAHGEVLIKVAACGVCHTDTSFRNNPEQALPSGLTMGHEIAGTVSSVGEGVEGFPPGTPVIVHTVWSCGTCRQCLAGRQNACLNTAGRLKPSPAPGTMHDGGMAEFVVVPARTLVDASGIDPVAAAVLPDAALVSYHCIHDAAAVLTEGASALVIGIGGLGQYAVSILSAISPVRIIAADVRESALDAVRDTADVVLDSSSPDIEQQVFDAAGGYGPDFILDLVGSTQTLALATSVIAPYGVIRVPGQANGTFTFETNRATTSIPRGATINRPYAGTYQDLDDVVELARAGRIGIDIQRYPFEDALSAFDDLDGGRVSGRAVLVMD